MTQLWLNCTPEIASHDVYDAVVNGSISGECIEQYNLGSGEHRCIVMVFEKYFWRNSSRASLTVTFDTLSGRTRMTAVGSGGGNGTFFSFDWGSSSSLENTAFRAVEKYCQNY